VRIVSLPRFGGVWKINISWARVRIEYNGQDSPELFLSFCIHHPTTIQFWLSWLDPQQFKKGRQYSTHWFGVYLTYVIWVYIYYVYMYIYIYKYTVYIIYICLYLLMESGWIELSGSLKIILSLDGQN
jgi:hypothetical protein